MMEAWTLALFVGLVLGAAFFVGNVMTRKRYFDFGASFDKLVDKTHTSFSPTDDLVYRSIESLRIPERGQLTPAERAWFDEIREQLEHGEMSAVEATDCVSRYIGKCRADRRLVDMEAVSAISRIINEHRPVPVPPEERRHQVDMYGTTVVRAESAGRYSRRIEPNVWNGRPLIEILADPPKTPDPPEPVEVHKTRSIILEKD